MVLLDCGCILTDPKQSTPERLFQLRNDLLTVCERYCPSFLAIERLFFSKNVKTALAVSEARGVILATLWEAGLHSYTELTPTAVKQILFGSGRADKRQIMAMVAALFPNVPPIRSDDAADAVAIAVASLRTSLQT